MKNLFKNNESGKSHSMKYEELDKDFAKFLRENYYNVSLSNYDVSEIKKQYNNQKL